MHERFRLLKGVEAGMSHYENERVKLYDHMHKAADPCSAIKVTLCNYTKEYKKWFGFSRKVRCTIYYRKEKISSTDIFMRHGLLIDEMKLSENLNVMPRGHIDGFVDLWPLNLRKWQTCKVWSRVVVVFVCFVNSWTQTKAVFAKYSNVKGYLQAEIMTEAATLA